MNLADTLRASVPCDPRAQQQTRDLEAYFLLKLNTKASPSALLRAGLDLLHEQAMQAFKAAPEKVTIDDLALQRRLVAAKKFREAEKRKPLPYEILEKLAVAVNTALTNNPKLAAQVADEMAEQEMQDQEQVG